MSTPYPTVAEALEHASRAVRRGFRPAARQLESALLPGEFVAAVGTAGIDGLAAIVLPAVTASYGRILLARRDRVVAIDPTAAGIKVVDKTHVVKLKVPKQPRMIIQRTPGLNLYPDPEWIGRAIARHVHVAQTGTWEAAA